ncbi:MAG: hypothetical protein IPK16_10115 [Anaerolineales bacterium]|nr:hypothetical protein [Anaerolineales bacterium]
MSIPLDALGNPIVDGNNITVQVEHPPAAWLTAGARQLISATTQSLLSNATIQARQFAGMLTAAATTGASHSPARRVLISPSDPVSITVTATPRSAPADGRTLITLDTGLLQDRYGNRLMDGMLVTFVVSGEDGERRTLPTTTLDGHAMLRMRAPKTPTAQTVVATLGEQVSEPLTLHFSPEAAFAPFALTASTTEGAVAFVAGPILGPLGQLVADDTPVVFTLTAPGGAVAVENRRTLNGYASYEKPADLLQAGVYTVTAASGGAQSSLLYEASADGD